MADLVISEPLLLRLAREIAIDIHPIDTILKGAGITPEAWENIRNNQRFIFLLQEEMAAWGTALNANERVKLKAATLLEEWLPELDLRLHDRNESLAAKVEGAKLAAKLAGIGVGNANVEGGDGKRFSITINLGADSKLKFEKDITPKVIDASASDMAEV